MTTVREMMTRDAESVNADDSVQDAAETMAKLNIGSVPVLADGRVSGIVTDRDIAIRLIAENRRLSDVKVREIASGDPVVIGPDADIASAARLMAAQRIRRLPVVEDGSLVGMLSLGDISADGDAQAAGQALSEISTPAAPER